MHNYCIIYANITDTRHKDDICRTVEQALSHSPPVSTLSRALFTSCDIFPTCLLSRLLISRRRTPFTEHASVVQKLDSVIHGILKTLSSILVLGKPLRYTEDRDLSVGQRYPPFEKLGLALTENLGNLTAYFQGFG